VVVAGLSEALGALYVAAQGACTLACLDASHGMHIRKGKRGRWRWCLTPLAHFIFLFVLFESINIKFLASAATRDHPWMWNADRDWLNTKRIVLR
jgi:hypothetical protein